MTGLIQPIHVWLTLIISAATIIGFLWKINRSFNRVIDVMIEYPPHRHVFVDGHEAVMYPKGYSPGQVTVEARSSAATAGHD